MAKSLLSSFKNDFNRTLEVYPLVESTNSIWEVEKTWPTASTTGIECLLLLRSEKYNAFASNEVEYIKTTHKVRMDFWPIINVWDKIKDEFDVWYNVKFVHRTPWFDWVDDHLLLLVDIITK